MSVKPITIVLADDHEVILDSLSLLISTMDGISVIAQFNDSRKVIEFIETGVADILITDYSMPYMNGIELSLQLKQICPQQKIIMLTVSEEAVHIREAFNAGALGYVMKKANKKELELAIRTVASGQKYISEAVMKELLKHGQQDIVLEGETELAALTSREIEIIKLIAKEYSSTDIGKELYISVGTVETHRHNILKKLGLKNSIGVAKYAIKNHLI